MEIKNWCASAKGGKGIKPGDDADWLKLAQYNYNRYLRAQDNLKKVWKVVAPMKPWKNDTVGVARPLLGFWSPVAPESIASSIEIEPLFAIKTSEFEDEIRSADMWPPISAEVLIFSASNYLRSKEDDCFNICMPRVAQRLAELQKLGIKLV
jgi:hypothetical protein